MIKKKTNNLNLLLSVLIIILLGTIACSETQGVVENTDSDSKKKNGPLRVSEINPRYFTDDSGKAIYLTGSHTWNNLVDMSPTNPPEEFDFLANINWMKKYNHNFIRLWTWELLRWDTGKNKNKPPYNHYVSPLPFLRTGPENALDGKPKFDLKKLNPKYFERLRQRVSIAADSGIYVSVMLFDGWGVQHLSEGYATHPFHPKNNINGIDADLNGDGKALEIHTLETPKITEIQKEYVQKVIETVNEFDNILYEIGNEFFPGSTTWQYEMINFIKDTEKQMSSQHPVGMTYQHKGGINKTLFDSPADWISPNKDGGYRDNPPTESSKIIISDTDHLWGIGGNVQWVWKSFLRGHHPIFMDSYDLKVLTLSFDLSWAEPIRINMGYTLKFAERMDLINMSPDLNIGSSTYCLANKGAEYLIYLPNTNVVSVNLTDSPGSYNVEWFNVDSGETIVSDSISGGANISMTSPFKSKDAVLYLKK